MSPGIRCDTGVVRGGRVGFVDITGAGGMFGEMGFGGGGFREADFGGEGFVERGFSGGIGILAVGVSDEAVFPGNLLLVRIFANFSANSLVTPS